MHFSVIFSVDCHPDAEGSADGHKPAYGEWLETENETNDDPWEGTQHRKWCAVISKSDFTKWIDDAILQMQDIETMGMIGAPGFGIGWAPAFSFDTVDSYDYSGNAYVCPLPDIEIKSGISNRERSWERLKKALLSQFA